MDSDRLLAQIRETIAAMDRPSVTGTTAWGLAVDLGLLVTRLDAHLSGGGTPPEAWREGPDAPELDDDGPSKYERSLQYGAAHALRQWAVRIGDTSLVQQCDRALAGDVEAGAACQRAWAGTPSYALLRTLSENEIRERFGPKPDPLGPINPAGAELPELSDNYGHRVNPL